MAVRYMVRAAVPTDAGAIAAIYNQGIEDRIATFETEERDGDERRRWLEEHDRRHPVVVSEASGGQVVGWGSISPTSPRECYAGVGEYSVYVRRDMRGRGFGSGLLESLIERATAEGYWKLIGRKFSLNEGSRRLSKRFGFRESGSWRSTAGSTAGGSTSSRSRGSSLRTSTRLLFGMPSSQSIDKRAHHGWDTFDRSGRLCLVGGEVSA